LLSVRNERTDSYNRVSSQPGWLCDVKSGCRQSAPTKLVAGEVECSVCTTKRSTHAELRAGAGQKQSCLCVPILSKQLTQRHMSLPSPPPTLPRSLSKDQLPGNSQPPTGSPHELTYIPSSSKAGKLPLRPSLDVAPKPGLRRSRCRNLAPLSQLLSTNSK